MTTMNLDNIDLGGFGETDIKKDGEGFTGDQYSLDSHVSSTMGEALKTDADQYSKNKQLSRDSGIPAEAVAGDAASVETHLKLKNIDFSEMSRRTPGTSEFLTDFDNAVIAQDDIDVMQMVEDTLRSIPGGLVSSIGMSFEGLGRTGEAVNRIATRSLFDVTPEALEPYLFQQADTPDVLKVLNDFSNLITPAALTRSAGAGLKVSGEDIADVPAERQNIATDIAGGLGQVSGQIVTTLMNPPLALGMMFGQGVDQQGERQEASGTEGQNNVSDFALLAGGGITAVTERTGIDALMNRIPPTIKNKILRQVADVSIAGGIEAVQEVVEGVAQGLLEQYTTNPDAEIFEGLDREAIAAGGTGAIVRALINGLTPSKVRSVQQVDDNNETQAITDQATLDQLNKSFSNMQMKQRDPETLKAFIDKVDTDDTHIFVDSVQASLFLQSKSDDDINADPSLQLIKNSIEESQLTGIDISIPLVDFATDIAGSATFDELRDHMTMTPEAVTPFRAEAVKEQTANYIQGLMTEAEQNVSQYVEAQEVFNTVHQQLVDTGQVTPQNASVMAQVVPAWATVYAKTNGISVQEAFEKSGLNITGPQTGERARLEGELEILKQSLPDRFAIIDAVKGRTPIEDIITQASSLVGTVDSVYSVDNMDDLNEDNQKAIQGIEDVAVIQSDFPEVIAYVWDKSGKVYEVINGNVEEMSTEQDPNSDLTRSQGYTLNAFSELFRTARNTDPAEIEAQRVRDIRTKETRRRQERLKDIPAMPADFDQALQELADWSENFEEFQKALNPDMFDISDRNLTRLGRATMSLDPEFETAGDEGTVTIYRALPEGEDIEAGDWVSFDEQYAAGHESNVGEEGGTTVSIEVPADEVYTPGTDENEWVYIPKNTWGDIESIEELWQSLTDGSKPDTYPEVEGGQLFAQSATGGFKQNEDGTYTGYKVMALEDGELRSGADSRMMFDMSPGSNISMPGNGVFLSNNPEYVIDYYSGLADDEVLIEVKFNRDDIVDGESQFEDREPEIGVSTVEIVSVTPVDDYKPETFAQSEVGQVDQTETDEFKTWSDNGEVVEPEDINDYEFKADTPVVLKVFHGTTHNFSVFEAERGNLEGQFGAVNYFTSSEQDANDNYAGEGPDLTNRIEQRAEQLEREIEDDPDSFDISEDAEAFKQQLLVVMGSRNIPTKTPEGNLFADMLVRHEGDKQGAIDELQEYAKGFEGGERTTLEQFSEVIIDKLGVDGVIEFNSIQHHAKTMAREELAGGQNQVMELYVKVNNPFVIGENADWIEFTNDDEVQELAIEEVASNNDISVDDVNENIDDYQDEIDEARWAVQEDMDHPLSEAIQTVSDRFDIDASELASRVYDLGDTARPEDVEQFLRNSEDYMYAEDPDTGVLIQSHLIGEVIREMGYDSIILKNAEGRFSTMNMEPDTTHVHLFDSGKTNIKSVENQGTFNPADPDIFRQDQVQSDKNLFVAHNISSEGILAAADLGGLAAPSLAVARADISDFSGFGEVTLLADPSLLEDSKARTFDADVYTPRQPRATYNINQKKYNVWREGIEADTKGLNLNLPYAEALSEQAGADNMLRSDSVKYSWLKSQGKEPKLKNRKVESTIKTGAKFEGREFMLRDDPKFIKLADKHYRNKINDIVEKSAERAERFEDMYFNEDGTVKSSKINDFASEVVRFRDSGGKDLNQLRHDISAKFRNNKLREQFEQEVTKDFNELVDGKTLFKGFTNSGNRKYTEYNMVNVVREMTQSLQGGEASFYGAPSVRSAYANEMKTIAQVQARRDQIIPEADLAVMKEDAASVFENAMEDLKPFYKFDADSWGYAEDAGTAIMEGPKAIREAFNVTPEVKKIIDDLTEYLSALPSTYFETKVQRAVDFSEFNTAVVPRGMNKEALQVLKDSGLKVKTYNSKVEGARAEVIAKQKKLLFQNDDKGTRGYYDPANSMIRLTEAADLSTFLHEFAHFMYEMEVNTGGKTSDSINNWFKRNAADVAKEANGYMESSGDFSQPAYHGTPHKFDRFSLEAIGTGEGAQAYGWGMYFAGKKSIAEFYRDAVSDQSWSTTVESTLINRAEGMDITSAKLIRKEIENNPTETAEYIYNESLDYAGINSEFMESNKDDVIGAITEVQSLSKSGNIYEVDIPEDSELLNYDAPLDSQGDFTTALRDITDVQHGEGTFDSYVENNNGGDFREWSDNLMEDFTDQDISMMLNEKGIKGLRYLDADSRIPSADGGTQNYVIWDEAAVTIESVNDELREAEAFAQSPELPGFEAGAITPDDVTNYIDNKTTGNKGKDQAIRRAVHEQFARGFETYLMEGKAPSVELRNAFRTFARWLTQIYKSIRGQLNVNLDDEMRQVFDRMLATEEQIDAANARGKNSPMFSDAEVAGMTEEQFQSYSSQVEKVKDVETETLRDKLIKEITRSTKKQWNDEKSDIIDEQLDILKKEKVYIAAATLKAPKTTDKAAADKIIQIDKDIADLEKQIKKLTKDNDTIGQFIAKAGGLNRESMEAEGVDPAHFKDKNKVFGKPMFPAKGGMTADDLAELFNEEGFNDGELTANEALEVVFDILSDDTTFIIGEVDVEIANIEDQLTNLNFEKEDTEGVIASSNIKLDHATVKDMVGFERTDKLKRKSTVIPPALVGMTAKGQEGVHPDIAAAMLGYSSGSEMINDLMNATPINQVAEQNAEAIMLERHGDIMNDGTIEKEADDAVHNEERGKLILTELKALRRGTNTPSLERAQIKAFAEDNIGNLTYRTTFPAKYRKAEIAAAQEAASALATGDKEAAARAKARQVLNYYLGNAATEARAKTEKIVDNMSRYNKKKVREEIQKADGGYWEQIVKILNRFEFRKTATLKSVDDLNVPLTEWMNERLEVNGDQLVITNPVMNETYQTHWKNVPFDILQGVNDSVKNIEHVARYGNKMTYLGEKLEFEKVVANWNDHMNEQPDVFTPQRTTTTENKNWLRVGMAQMTKIPFMASWLDGGERVGMSHELLMDGLNKAGKDEQVLWKQTGEKVTDAILARSKEDVKRHMSKIFIPEIKDANNDGNLMGSQIIAVALNTGNAGNLRKMLLGEGWANPDVDTDINLDNPKLKAVLTHMTKSDWELVQHIWDQMESLYKPLAEVHRRTTGLIPPQVEAVSFTNEHGTFRGGYYPVVYDHHRSGAAALNKDRADAQVDSMFGGMMSIQAAVTAGSTNERTGYYGPINLNLDVVPNHFQETIHFITHHDAVRQLNRLITDQRIRKTITAKLGPDEYAQLKPWLNDMAKEGAAAPPKTFIDAAFARLRSGVTLGVMGFKASTGIIQISGVFNTYAEVGTKHMNKALSTVYGRGVSSIKDATEFAFEHSNIMETRTKTMDREIKNVLSTLSDNKGLKVVQEASMKHIALIQFYTADLLSWHAAYTSKLEETGDLNKAYKYADWVVENVQGSGATKDMAALMRNQSKVHTTFTMFMTFFSSLWNMERDLVRGTKSGRYSSTTVAAKSMFLFTLPVIFEMMMRGDFSGDDEPEEQAQKVLTNLALFPIASVPFVRDIASGIGSEYGYNSSPVASMLEQGVQGTKGLLNAVIDDEDVTYSQLKSTAKLTGAGFKIPGIGQAFATGEHLYDVLEEGEELTLHQLLFGPKKD